MIWLLIPFALILAFATYLLWPGAGTGTTWITAPGGPLPFRLRRRSLVPKILGSDGVTLFGVVHVAAGTISPYLLAHEVYHARSARRLGHPRFLWRYLTSSTFRAQEESEAHQFGLDRMADPWIVTAAGVLSR